MNPTHTTNPFNNSTFKKCFSEYQSVTTHREKARLWQTTALHLNNNPFYYEPNSCAKQLALAYLHGTRVCFSAQSKRYPLEEKHADPNRIKEVLFVSDKKLTERKASLPYFNLTSVDVSAEPLKDTEICTYKYIWSLYDAIRFRETEGNIFKSDTFSCESLLSSFQKQTPDSRKEMDRMFWDEVAQSRGAWVERDEDYSPKPIPDQSVSYPMTGLNTSNPELLSYLEDSLPKQLIETYDARKVSDWSIEVITERVNQPGKKYHRTVYVNKEPHKPAALYLRTSQQVSNKDFHWYVISELFFQDTQDLNEAIGSPAKLNEIIRQKYDWALRACFDGNDIQWGDVDRQDL